MGNFNPKEHMMKLKGKDYLEVKWRLVWFREDHPDFGIYTELIELDEKHAVFKAAITNVDGRLLSSGTGSESVKDFADFIEKAETKAVGRALAMLGYGTQFDPDLEEGSRIVDAPVTPRKSAVVPKMATAEQIAYITENASPEVCMAMMNKYGVNLENLTFANADKAIAKLKGE
jgi:hypothetical protein